MEKKAVSLKRLLLLCVFVLMMGVIFIPQTAHADGPPTIYWAVTSGNLVISDQEVQGDTKGNFPGTKAFTQSDRPGWIDTYVKTVRIEGRPRPMRTDYWFYFCMDLTDADLTGLDLSTCWSTVRMFGYCTSLKSVDLSKLGFSSYLQEMSYMFSNCSDLVSVDMTDLKIPKCTRMDSMFSGCSKLAELDLSTTDLTGASDPRNYGMGSMLNGCSSLKKIVLGSTYQAAQVNFPYANHTDGYWICQETGAYYFGAESIPAGSGTYNYTTDIPEEYKAYWALTANGQNYDLVISPDQVTGDYSGQYYTLINPLAWEKSVSKDKIISVEFKTGAGGAKVKYNDLSFRINSSDVGLFDNYKNLQSVKLDGLDASACRRTYRMFCNCSSLTSVDLRGTGLASVDSAGAMFSGCTALTEVLFDPDNKVKFGNVSSMFYNCSSLEAVDLRSIDASTWTEARNTFSGCSKIKKLNCMDIDTGNIKNLQNMLDGCTSLELLLAGSSWDGEGWAEWYYNGPSLPHDMYEITRKNSDGSYYKLPKGTELQGADRKSSVFFSIYVNEALLNNASELAKWEKLVEIAQDALKLSGITDPKERKDAGIAALEAFEALPDEVQEYLPDSHLGYIQKAVNTVLPLEITVKWSSMDGEDLTDPLTFAIPEGGITVGDFLSGKMNALRDHFAKDGYTSMDVVGYKPMTQYSDETSCCNDPDNIPGNDLLLTADTTLYFYLKKNEPSNKPGDDQSGTPAADPGSDPNQNGADGTPVGPGASAAAAERAITNMVTDDDPQGTVFGKVALKSPKQTKSSIDLSWNPVPNAASYVIFGNKCGKGNKPLKLGVVNGTRQTVSTVANQKVAKGTYYKFVVVALDRNNTVVSTSKVIHVATKGGKVGNHKKVTVKKSVIKKARKLKKGKSLKLKAKAVPQSKKLKVRKHRAVLYESSDINIATVSKKGVVKAKNKGTCYIYAYAQNGVYKKIKVTVK